MEVFAGARTEGELALLRRLMARCTVLRTVSADYEMSAAIFRNCRQNGKTPRKMLDCLIASIAIRNEVELLHVDQDFEVIAENSALQTL